MTPNNAGVFYVLDFDRTLGDTDKLYAVLELILERHTKVKIRDIYAARAKAEQSGDSFDTVTYLRQLLSETGSEGAWLSLQREFITTAQQGDMLEPYAKELLERLDVLGVSYGVLTFGNEAWQLAKLEAAGLLKVPHLVTRIKEKGHLLAGWKQEDGIFIIPPAMTRLFEPMHVSRIVFIDDKAVSFKDLPSGVQGIYVRSPDGKVLPSQMGELPSGVATVIGLDGAIELLFKQ